MLAYVDPVAHPLSAAQMEIWLAQQINPDSPVYNIGQFTQIHGAVDRDLFEIALRQVVAEAQSPRLQFVESSDGLRQCVGSPKWSLPFIDFSAEGEPQAAAEAWMRADYERPVDLLRGPLFDYALLKVASDRFLWYRRCHHIVVDGVGFALIAQRMAQVYSALIEGVAANKCPFGPISLLLENDARYRASAQCTKDRAYWLQYCANWPEPVTLANRYAPALHHRIHHTAYLSSESVRAYAADASRLAQLITAAMAAYLHRLTGAQDIGLGFPVTGRFGEDRRIPGVASNVLPIRLAVQSDMSLSSLIEQAAQEIQRGFRHQRYRSEALRRELGLEPNQPLFGPTINLMPFDYDLSFGGHASSNHNLVNGPIEDLMIAVYTQSDGSPPRIDFEANPTLYTIDELITHQRRFLKFLDALVIEPAQPISRIDLLDAKERRQLLVEWNATERDYPAHQCIHQLFEEQAERKPEATALVYENQVLSYAGLNARANHLAHQLMELSVQPGDYIATVLERSVELVAAQLAILKVGAAYVPIDPKAPAQRQAWIVADCAARLLIADAHTEVSSTLLVPLLRLTSSHTNETDAPIANPDLLHSSLDTAYVMYTSGSTGTPKGVLVPHRAVARLVINSGYADIGVNDRVAFAANPAFDASTFEVWAPLLNGGTLVVIDHDTVLTPNAFVQTLQKERISIMWLTVGLFNQLAVALEPVFPQLKTLIVGGDALDASVIAQVLRNTPPQRLINGYGPTESTTFATTYRIVSPPEEGASIPIGRPIANTRLYLLDKQGQPVPLGAVGELYLGGAGVALGYLNRPELTAERFLPDPFSHHENARMYKTGDLARYLPDGNLEFLGRNDQQIKIRGFRIEPGEIEARLVEHPQVHEAAVLVLGKDRDKRLVAYVVAKPDEQLASTLRSHLMARLPEYMMPVAFVRLDALPLTPNGKLDRRALPAPDDEALVRQTYEAPQGEIETALARIWAELFKIEQISRHDSFFALGGHSLLAVQMIERLRRLGLTVSVRTLFETPTLSVLAQSLGHHHEVTVPSNLITPNTTRLTPDLLPLINLTQTEIDRIVEQTPGGMANIQDIYALSPLQDGILFHHLLTTDGDPYLLIIQMAFANRALLDRYLEAVQQVVNRHDILRTAFVWESQSTPAQVVWRHAPLSITELALDPAAGLIPEQLAQRVDARRQRIELTQAPLLRFVVAPDSNGRWLLVQLVHHLIVDHSTLEGMNAEIQAVLEGRGDALPAPQPFRNLVAQARLGLSQEAHERFFTEMLADLEEPTLPFGLAEVYSDGARASESHQMLPQGLNDRLRVQAKRLGVSLASLCHLAWAQVLARASGQQRVVFGTVLFGRMHAGKGAGHAMGLFINTLPLRIDLESGNVQDSVRVVHAHLASLLEHEYASLALAQRCSAVPAGVPLFSALLNYRHNTMPLGATPTTPGIEFLSAQESTNYPFTLSVEDFGSALGLTAQVVEPLDSAKVCGYMQQTLQSLADALERAPDMPVWQLEVLPIEERECLLQTWNATTAPYPEYKCIHQLFEEQVKRTPEATALVYENQGVSYAELNASANRLAHQLIKLGVQPDTYVAICVKRSPAMVVGLLATLKAGGAYVPLDPAYPHERLTYILTDAAPAFLLADTAGRAVLGETMLATLTVLDPNALPEEASTDPDVPALTSHHLAYVIYTSGSTGAPKGVMVLHRGLNNYLHWAAQTYAPKRGTVVSSSLSFDATVTSLWTPLLYGSTALLLSEGKEIEELEAYVHQAQGEGLVKITPVHFEMLGQRLQTDAVKTRVAAFVIGGEALSASTIAMWQRIQPGVRLINEYGPTETVVGCVVYDMRTPLSQSGLVPIGRPIANTRIYLLDAHGQPVPLGAVGELYVGGAGVARGYLNRPELTAERFLTDPFSDALDARMYKTGDLARYLADGNLEFLGRNDHQVKIRGFRIEPGEIEARLVEHPQVREAAVLALSEESEKRLIAYVVAKPDEQLASTLRSHLTTRLPEYMMPAAFVRLDALPLTPNGKLDRCALPAPDDEAFARQTYEAPAGEIETTLATIWSELLGLERVSRHDSFFALGGHSLLAVQMIECLRRLGLKLSVRALFNTPTLSVLAQALGQHRDVTEVTTPPNLIPPDTAVLTPDMLPLIDLTQTEIDRIVEQTPGGVANIQDIYALSPLQDGILFHHLLTTEGDPYLLIIQMAFANRALLDRYLEAVQQVVDRHDILRTAFVWECQSTPAQVVWRHAPLSITELAFDAAAGPITEQLIQCVDPRQHRIDLTQAPLLRFVIAQDSNGRWLLVELLHHLIGDHSTLEVMQAEIQAFLDGRGDTLPPPQPFRNLIAQTRLGLNQQEHTRFFTELLADVEEPTLPFGLAEVYSDGAQASESHQMLPQDLNDRLRAQVKRLGVSLASLCHLAWALVLGRASAQQHVVFGTVLFGRMQAGEGSDRAMGLFINTLPLRVDLDHSGVEDSVRQTHKRLAALLEHEHASLALAQRCSGVPAGVSLFSALLNYRHNTMPLGVSPTTPGIEFLSAQESTNYPFTLSVEDFGSALGLTAQVVQPIDSARVCGYMQQTLQSLADALERAPDMPVWQLEVLPTEERVCLLQTFNATTAPYPEYQCIHQLFEEQVTRTPKATALVYEDQVWSYAELNMQANYLARQLMELGAQPGDYIATLLERSVELVAAQLAILKVGAAYVPIDPQTSAQRQAWIVADCAARLLITDVHTQVSAALPTPLLRLTSSHTNETKAPIANLDLVHSSLDTAYVMYTSGSTGTPKGVLVPHRAVARLVINSGYVEIEATDRVAFAANPAFDASTFEVWAPLLNGGTLVVIDHDTVLTPNAFVQTLQKERISIMWLTVGLFNQLAVALEPVFPQLKTLIVGGDALDASVIAQVLRNTPPQRLINGYGPTESTTFATTYRIVSPPEEGASIPIGRPIANTRVYLLDTHGQPVPLGAVGELYIGGAGIALGYLNRPELTTERFLPDPFSDHENARMYKTGDLARYLPDGNLEFLGRNDHQLKIRGFRIEPGEIEARLVEHPQVREAAVLALGKDSDKRLIAYVVAKADESLASALRTHLAASLPEYMVPTAFVRLDAMPLTPNGKLDRRALPTPDDEAFARQAYEAPQGKIEAALANIWAELLKIEQISRHDSFFALGGHSLLAVQMIQRLRRIGLTVSVRALFDTPTLSVLAQSLDPLREVATPPNLVTLSTTALTPDLLPLIDLTQAEIDRIVEQTPGGLANIQDIYGLSPLQDGILFHHLLATEGDPYLLIAQMAFAHRALLDRYLDAIQQVVNRHDVLRTAFVWENVSSTAQVVWRHAPLSITELTLDPADGPIPQQLIQRFDPRQHCIDLTQAPLLRFVIAQDSNGRWLLIQLLHHLIGDHSTLEVMQAEIQAFLDSRGDTLPAPQPFRNLIAQTRLGLSQQDHERFFTEMLADVEEPTLPFSLAEVHGNGAQVTESHQMLPQDLNDRLRAQAKQWSVSLASLCHLAFALVLGRVSAQQHVVFGTVLFGRMQAGEGADRAMGLFINTLPLRVDLDDHSVQDGVYQTHARLAALLEHEHASLALAQRCSGVLAGAPLFSALLNYRHNAISSDKDLSLSGMEFLGGQERTNYPFTLSVEDFGSALGLTVQIVQPIDSARVCGYMQQTLQSLAEALEQAPNMPVWQLEVLPTKEREYLLQTFNATTTPYPEYQCIHQLFEEQVTRTPKATALVYEDQVWSYAELNTQANYLARQLMELGAQPGDYIATLLERSVELVVAQLAILKVGAAYVPIDPKAPAQRQAWIVADCAARLLIADAHTEVSSILLVPLLRLTSSHTNETDAPIANPDLLHSSLDTAYVMYTSGSTGTPKGVLVPHRAVARLVINSGYVEIEATDRVAFAANPAFDASTFEVWAPLLNGGTLVVIDHDTVLTPNAFVQTLQKERISIMWLTVGLFNQLAVALEPVFPQLKTLIVGGDALDASVIAQVLRNTPPQRLINGYGPTESTTFATTYRIVSPPEEGASIPIGRPIANTRVYLLDTHGQPVPLGAVGELYLGGAGIALGYLNRPELTAERFLTDPFSNHDNARMYKTGDLARYLPDGNLEFLGRNDHQLKIRGFRIEPGEIEARLIEHPQVREAAVLTLGEGGDKRLIAYVVAEADEQLAYALRAHLSTRLSEYMMPTAFARLDALPLTPNGKLDRRALPTPDGGAFARQAYETPQGEIETALAAIWAKLLGLERISRHDSFFALGGHSLLAVQMANHIYTTLGVEITLRTLFEAPTVAGLTQRILKLDGTPDDSFAVLLPIQPKGTRPPLFCIHPAAGLSWSYIALSKHLDADQPVYGLQARGLNGTAAPAKTIDAMVSDYLRQIRHIQPNGPYYLLGWSFGGCVAHSIATQLEQQGERVALLALLDSYPDYSLRTNELEMDHETDYLQLLDRYSDQGLQNAGEYLWGKIRDVIKNNCHILKRFAPRIYCGDMLFFRATITEGVSVSPTSPNTWKPYVLGDTKVYDIHCTHGDMDRPAPTAEIGRILARKLDELQKSQPPQSEEALFS